jgi:beta-glucosidase/6-phospho-beta-glucosidase/beta-galactosidase
VVNENPEYFENFVRKWVERYKDKIDYWEILNEPKVFHKGLTVMEYVDKILKPSYKIIKEIDPGSKVLPCAYNNLPIIGSKEDFWDAARGYYDIQNYHLYSFWGYLRFSSDAGPEVDEIQNFRNLMIRHGEKDKEFWITETGWFGTEGVVGLNYYYRTVPNILALKEMLQEYDKSHSHEDLTLKPYYTGEEIMKHSVTIREDSLCAYWMKDLYPRVLSIPGCTKVFHWVVMDEFEGGYKPKAYYGSRVKGDTINVKGVSLWAIIGGDKKWRKSAFFLKEIIKQK